MTVNQRLRRPRFAIVALVLVAGLASCSSDSGSDAGDTSGGSADETTTTAAAGDGTDEGGSDDAGAPGAASGEVSVLSYNVAGLPAEISDESPDVNIPKISPLLNDYDVVLTQEDFDWWPEGGLASGVDFVNYHARLRAEATHEFQSPRHPGPDATALSAERKEVLEIGDGLGVLSRLPIEGDERVPWTDCFGGFDTSDGGAADCLAMKGFQFTRLELAEGVVVDLYNLHGEAGGSDRDQQLQAADYQQLAAFIEANSAGNAIILGGDTNLHTDPPGDGAHEDSAGGEDLAIWDTFLEATGLTDACEPAQCEDPGRIDKIAFRSDGGIDLEVLAHQFQTERFSDDAGEALSDHDPLEVRFAWTAAG